MNWQDVLKALIPVVVASIAWLLGQVSSMQTRIVKLEGQMPMLITPQGIPTDSPISAEARHKLKEDLFVQINDLNVRLKLLEERQKKNQ